MNYKKEYKSNFKTMNLNSKKVLLRLTISLVLVNSFVYY